MISREFRRDFLIYWESLFSNDSLPMPSALQSEFPELWQAIKDKRLNERIDNCASAFGSSFEAVGFMQFDEFLRVLPLAAFCAVLDKNDILARAIVWELVRSEKSPFERNELLRKIPNELAGRMMKLLNMCLKIGWDDKKRRERARSKLAGFWEK